jgi:LysR family transcriptional regulator, hydrogen peroxide-inducible genes activator
LRLGAIYTIAPYLLPPLIGKLAEEAPHMPIEIEENFTHQLEAMLKQGQIDCALIALPFELPGLVVDELFEEPFVTVVPTRHEWAQRESVDPDELSSEHCILLSVGNCFRNHVLQACPELNAPSANTGKSSSLETVRNMVASGLGISVMPRSAMNPRYHTDLVRAIPFAEPVPSRRVGLAYRAGFARSEAITTLKRCVRALPLEYAVMLTDDGRPA